LYLLFEKLEKVTIGVEKQKMGGNKNVFDYLGVLQKQKSLGK